MTREDAIEILRKIVERYLVPDELGGISGYGGKYDIKGDKWQHEAWSDACDYQHAAIDIFNEFKKEIREWEKKNG